MANQAAVFDVFDNGTPHKAVLFGGPGPRNGVTGGQQFLDSLDRIAQLPGIEVHVQIHSWLASYPYPNGGILEREIKLKNRKPGEPHPFVDPASWALWLRQAREGGLKNLEMEKAKAEYRQAYETGDTDKIIEAQQKITDTALKLDRVKNFKPAPLPVEKPYVPIQAQTPAFKPPTVDPTAVEWQKNNQWFGKDKLMTGMALALHEQLKEEGVTLSSDEYYRRIDETMRQRFPEKFASQQNDDTRHEESRTRPSTVVAPATRSTSPKKIRLTQSQLAISKKLGLTPEQYAQAVLKMEA